MKDMLAYCLVARMRLAPSRMYSKGYRFNHLSFMVFKTALALSFYKMRMG